MPVSSPSTYIYRAWVATTRKVGGSEGTLYSNGYRHYEFSPSVKVTPSGFRTPDIALGGPAASRAIVVEVKDTNTIHDCHQIRDLNALDPVHLTTVVSSMGPDYAFFLSCGPAHTGDIRTGLDDCGCPSTPIAEVMDDGIHLHAGDVNAALIQECGDVLLFPFESLETIPAELLRFSPEAPDWEIAPWVSLELIALAQSQAPPFTPNELTRSAASITWELLGNGEKQRLVNVVRNILVEAAANHLNGYIHALGDGNANWTLNYPNVLNANTGEPKDAFINRCHGYARWKSSTQASAQPLLGSG